MAPGLSGTLLRAPKPQSALLSKALACRSSAHICAVKRCLCSAAASYQSQENGRAWWSKWLLFAPGAITFGLGTWQIFRREEKIKMLDYRKRRLDMEPIALNATSYSAKDHETLEFRRVTCEGIFDESSSIFVGPRSRSISGVAENGYFIITPLMPAANNSSGVQLPILVNRGWVPRSWREKHLEDLHNAEELEDIQPPDVEESKQSSWWQFWSKKPEIVETQEPIVIPVKVVGVVRGSEKPSIFVPANEPTSGQWFYVDISEIARACDLPEDTLYIEDINENTNASQPYPIPKDVNSLIRYSVMPQDHLNYTLTWYSLSAAVTFMAIKRLKPKKSRR